MTPAQRPHMGDAWKPFLFRSADPGRVFFFFFFRGNSSCLATLILSVWLYLYLQTYSNKEACTKNTKRSRPPVTELKQTDENIHGCYLHLLRYRR